MTAEYAANILELKRPWTAEKIKRAYKKRSRDTHPDRGGSDQAFNEVATAREVLETHLEQLSQLNQAPHRPPPSDDRLRPMRPQTHARARRQDWNSGWYDTGDARARAARSDPYFQGRMNPQQPKHGEPYRDYQEDDDGAAKAGDTYIVKALTIGNINVNPKTVRAQLQKVKDGYQIAVYLTHALPVVSGNIRIILAEDEDDPGSVFVKPIASRSYNADRLVKTVWFDPFEH